MLETKIFNVAGTKLIAESSASKFKATKEANGTYKLVLELIIPGNVGSRLKEFQDFNATEQAVLAMPGLVFMEKFNQAVPGSDGIQKASVVLTHDKDDIVTLTASVDLPDGGKTQSAF